MTGKAVRAAREGTDGRLRAERRRTDDELAKVTRAAANEVDDVVRTARTRAADTLRSARQRGDEQMRAGNASKAERVAADDERSQEDDLLRKAYMRADKTRLTERAERGRLAAGLLAQERLETDRGLLLERGHADEVVARRDEFLAMVSHELRNELSGIALGVGQILRKASDDEDGRKVLRSATTIQRINLRMSRLIGDLLDVIRIDVGKFTVVHEDHDVSGMVDDIVESFAPTAAARGISLTVKGVDGALSARFDHQRIQQVLRNLLTNALKYSSDGGRVTLCAERKGDAVWVAVADKGCGISADHLETIFDRFSQGARPDPRGLGLGLYIARSIVEAHGGRIWAESRPGRGSTFYFTLPLRRARRPPHSAHPHPASSVRQRSVEAGSIKLASTPLRLRP